MRIESKSINEIIPYENNPRKNDSAIKAVVESIKQCSYITPIVTDENNIILAGHTRYKALKVLGYERISVLICEGLTEEQKKKYRYLDNKTGEKATWDLMKLEIELEGLELGEFDFFGVADDFNLDTQTKHITGGSIEFDMESFADEEFKYKCPKCGFRFN